MAIEKKYKLTDEFITIDDKKLYRIESLKDFSDVKNGERGGFVESEDNLSQCDNCWIYGDAKVYNDAYISENAIVCGNAQVYGEAKVFGNSQVYDNAHVFVNAKVYGNAYICGDAKVFENVEVYNNAVVYGNVKIYGNTKIYDYAYICGDAKVFGDAKVYDYATICGDAVVASNYDYMTFKNVCPNWKYLTWTRSNNMWNVGCFYGTGEELIEKAYKDSELSDKERKQIVEYVESIKQQSLTVEK